ncbi:hypothetical protein R5W23_003258 [Gemmata sp. JC673]|uniref:Uncharacterized protein n=1 Tax=Gemmata algarum TaxID=2975278 RepID=A0ABU5F3B9_9BACT|nr:hypothetical protein [Gemmata algarum]
MLPHHLRNSCGVLSDLIRVCCHCRRERTTHDEWREHVPVAGEQLTHGICPDCIEMLYPDLAPTLLARV